MKHVNYEGINGRRLFTTGGAGGGGQWLALILSLCEGGVEINFCSLRGGV